MQCCSRFVNEKDAPLAPINERHGIVVPNQFVRLHFLKAADCFGDKPIARAAKNVLNPVFGDDVAKIVEDNEGWS